MRLRSLAVAVLALALASPAFAADSAVRNGIDVWYTSGNGGTYIDFSRTPIPADFFCPGSAPLVSTVTLKGDPVVVGGGSRPSAADTIVQRLDDAVFNKDGIATTRLQVRALQLASVAPIETSCGRYELKVGLDGKQPVTTMTIRRQGPTGGTYLAPLSLETKLQFVPAGGATGRPLTLSLPVNFQASPQAWHFMPESEQSTGLVLVDTDGDQQLDTYLPGRSNFQAGDGVVRGRTCHLDPVTGKNHCVWDEPWCGCCPC